jgi:Spy/CpxP family protein refolding chaperone
MTAKLKPWLILAVIFVAGGLSGAALIIAVHPGQPRHDMQQMWMLQLTRKLDLTSDQQGKIKPIIHDTVQQVQKIHREEIDKVGQLLKASDDQIAAILTPDQKAELQQMIDERQKDFNRHIRQWGPPRDGNPYGGPPPEGSAPVPPPPEPPAPPSTNAPPK